MTPTPPSRTLARDHLRAACTALGLPADPGLLDDLQEALPEWTEVRRKGWGRVLIIYTDGTLVRVEQETARIVGRKAG